MGTFEHLHLVFHRRSSGRVWRARPGLRNILNRHRAGGERGVGRSARARLVGRHVGSAGPFLHHPVSPRPQQVASNVPPVSKPAVPAAVAPPERSEVSTLNPARRPALQRSSIMAAQRKMTFGITLSAIAAFSRITWPKPAGKKSSQHFGRGGRAAHRSQPGTVKLRRSGNLCRGAEVRRAL